MAVAGGEGVEKLEDMIVRAAETTATHIAAAKAADRRRDLRPGATWSSAR